MTGGAATVEQPDNHALLAAVYDELRLAAARLMRREARGLTLRPTDLVDEAALRVLDLDRMTINDRNHMFATASRLLRQVMIDEIRKRRAAKRQPVDLTIAFEPGVPTVDIEDMEDALCRLEKIAPELATLVEQRFYVGLSVPEVAALSGQSERTVKRRWRTARAWLSAELSGP